MTASGTQSVVDTKPSASDFLTTQFPAFDWHQSIANPFEKESNRDEEFQKELSDILLELMLEFHAWSSSRPIHERDITAMAFEKEMEIILETENEQEKARRRLNEFVDRIKMALVALTGL
ncbi:hypothetical protein PHLGIDRAFT_98508 [Phlebiopsis gigantea 11061_1 CR5-6]|uniref:Mediator of RNA polymerase II transcription subunit 7 n=1 Tax=Phlebiopsis gigantea (strain 11061_1 CR5-6) TaxID=745531 RepID=A0A0C3SDU0_PHLG1|nr:hypothetical protein PHLGIDRAFT_98508 [Phlebiopsis gigantea 11061_1 CR5-6]